MGNWRWMGFMMETRRATESTDTSRRSLRGRSIHAFKNQAFGLFGYYAVGAVSLQQHDHK